MARFEMTISNGEKILVDHDGSGIHEILAALDDKDFLLLKEVKGGSSTPACDVIVASAQVTLIRPLGEHSTQGTTFRPKR